MECLRIGVSIERKRIRHEMNTKSRQHGPDWERYVGNSPILWWLFSLMPFWMRISQVVEPWNSQMMTLTFLFLSERLRIGTVVSERKNRASDRSWLQGLNHRGLIRQMSLQSVGTSLTVVFHSTCRSTFTDHPFHPRYSDPYCPIQYYAQRGEKKKFLMREEARVGRDKTLQFAYFGDDWALCISDEMVSPLPEGISGDTRQCLTDD
jgi:hypothetical protein